MIGFSYAGITLSTTEVKMLLVNGAHKGMLASNLVVRTPCGEQQWFDLSREAQGVLESLVGVGQGNHAWQHYAGLGEVEEAQRRVVELQEELQALLVAQDYKGAAHKAEAVSFWVGICQRGQRQADRYAHAR